jgi:hypothetical protein
MVRATANHAETALAEPVFEPRRFSDEVAQKSADILFQGKIRRNKA